MDYNWVTTKAENFQGKEGEYIQHSSFEATCKRTQQLPKLLALQCWDLLRPCWRWCANGWNDSRQCWDLECIVGRIQPIRPCGMQVRGPKNVERAVQTDPISTLLHYSSAITEQKTYLLGVVGSKVWPPSNSAQQLPTTRDNMQHVCKRTQHVTSNNVGRCWPAMSWPFSRGLKNIVTHILPFLLQFFLVIRWYRSFYSSFSLFRFGYLETINIKALNGESAFYNWNVDATVVELSLKLLFNNYSLSPNGLWVNSPWGRRANGLLTQRPWGREE